MRYLLIALVLLSGCASVTEKAEPYFDMKVVWQNDSGSDWMLRSARPWVDDGRFRYQAAVGLEWDHNIDCPFLAVSYQSLNWTQIGCAKSFGGKPKGLVKPFLQVDLRHQVDELSDWWIRTDHPDLRKERFQDSSSSDIMRYNAAYQNGVKWTGQNPFYHLRLGLEWKLIGHKNHKIFRFKCPVIATGRSLTQGAPLESEKGAPDLYWSHLECRVRMGGK